MLHNFAIVTPTKMHKMYPSELKFNLESFVFISRNVIILLSINNSAITRQNISVYIKALETCLAYYFQTSVPLGLFV